MPVLQYINKSRPLEMIDNVVDRWAKAVVPFFMSDPNSKHRVLCCGSGFVVQRHNVPFLVTAHHVLKDLTNGEPLVANIAGKGALINGLRFLVSKEDDLAIAPINPTWAEEQGIQKVLPVPLETPGPSWVVLENFILLGYPGSQNKLNSNTNETTRQLIAYSSSHRIQQPASSTHIRNPVGFFFDKKSAVNTDENRINIGPFNGNSGGPVLEICHRFIAGDTLNLSVVLAGVFIGWDKNCKELICCRPDAVAGLIDSHA